MIKDVIEKQFKLNTEYNNPDQAVNQMESLFSLSKDLYTDSIRFIYELIQNADDANVGEVKVKITVRLFENKLIVAHTGKAFDERDIQGLCAVKNGTKKKATDKTGFKGIGFKSVFAQSENVVVFSAGEYFRFDSSYEHSWRWEETKESWETAQDRTFKYPWQIIPIYTEIIEIEKHIHQFILDSNFTVATIIEFEDSEDIRSAISELAEKVEMFLFLKHVEEISFYVKSTKIIKFTSTLNNETVLTLNDVEKSKFLLKNIKLTVPVEVKKSIAGDSNVPEKLQLAEVIEISIAAKIGSDSIEIPSQNESLIYAYLPTEERRYYFPVLVNAAFLTTANREALHTDYVWNQWLFISLSKELFKWIAELVLSNYADDAYKLIPDKLPGNNLLIKNFNDGIDQSILNLPFVLNYEGNLLKIRESIIDETFLINNPLFGKDLIKNFLINEGGLEGINLKPFVPHRRFTNKFKKLGVSIFKWSDFPKLISSPLFLSQHSIVSNTQLITLLKKYCEEEKPIEINNEFLSKLPFLYDHKNQLKSPESVFFPQIDDLTWNSPDSELSFIHPELQEWLDGNVQIKLWITALGVVEKSDLTYFHKTILPNAASYINHANAIDAIKSIFMLYKRNEINSEDLENLSSLRLLTVNNTLIPADKVYFSAIYRPKLNLEQLVQDDFFLNENYFSAISDLDDWKRFFKFLGVKEQITLEIFNSRTSRRTLIDLGFDQDYFELEDKFFTPFLTKFKANAFQNLTTLHLISECLVNIEFAKVFWSNVINHINLNDIDLPATAYWGNIGKRGDTTGDPVRNYLNWYINNKDCITTCDKRLLSAKSVFLNDDRILEFAGNYLPVFDGPQLDHNWKSFFNFKTTLQLEDYFLLLKLISEDLTVDNKSRIQNIYGFLLESLTNWDSTSIENVKVLTTNLKLLDQEGNYVLGSNLKHYPDGDSSIFQNKFNFIHLNAANKKHPNLEDLLSFFNVEILHQSSFKLLSKNESKADDLAIKLSNIIPYWAKWTEKEAQSGYDQREYELRTKYEKATFKSADELVITFGEDWRKEVSVYLKDNIIHVLTDWQANDVILMLSVKLCEYFNAKRFESELSFLLKSTDEEIIRFFKRENIELPKFEKQAMVSTVNKTNDEKVVITHDFRKSIDYITLWNNNIKRNEYLISDSNGDSKAMLIKGLKQQKPGSEINIYHFSHLENAVTIIKQEQLKSRQSASFQDSAGAGIISQTLEDRKQYARFYFRSHTPTQFYVENWGRGHYSLEHIGSDPVCPVPVFFIIPIEQVIDNVEWKVSLGTMASSHVEYGNSFDTVSKFDFEGVYKIKSEIEHDRYMVASHQEFLVKDHLNLENLNYRLAVQDEAAKNSLLIMLNDNTKWENRIEVNSDFFYNENPKIDVDQDGDFLKTRFDDRKGNFVLQYVGNSEWTETNLLNVRQFQNDHITTVITDHDISLFTNFDVLKYNLFYCYKGNLWLINTNNPDEYTYNTEYIKFAMEHWLTTDGEPLVLIDILKMHPQLSDWYQTSIGGPDNLTLEQHTIAVIENYQKYFGGTQRLFPDEKIFLIFLALHDIGKPKAISLGSRYDQHKYTLEIIEIIKTILCIPSELIELMKIIINDDPIGRYLNPLFSEDLDITSKKIQTMQERTGIEWSEFWSTYLVYYQCDAGGYQSLIDKVFNINETSEFILTADNKRFTFEESYEAKFILLENKLNEL